MGGFFSQCIRFREKNPRIWDSLGFAYEVRKYNSAQEKHLVVLSKIALKFKGLTRKLDTFTPSTVDLGHDILVYIMSIRAGWHYLLSFSFEICLS